MLVLPNTLGTSKGKFKQSVKKNSADYCTLGAAAVTSEYFASISAGCWHGTFFDFLRFRIHSSKTKII